MHSEQWAAHSLALKTMLVSSGILCKWSITQTESHKWLQREKYRHSLVTDISYVASVNNW